MAVPQLCLGQAYYPQLRLRSDRSENLVADRYERSGKRLGLAAGPASSSTRSRGGSSLWHGSYDADSEGGSVRKA